MNEEKYTSSKGGTQGSDLRLTSGVFSSISIDVANEYLMIMIYYTNTI